MHLLRRIDRRYFQMDFLVHTPRECDYDVELRCLGSSVHYCPSPRNPLQYAMNFRRILRQRGPYHVLHSHLHHFSGYVLKLAHHAGVPVRIAHSHNTEPGASSAARAVYQAVCDRWIRAHATHLLGVSKSAGENLFGPAWSRDARSKVLSCGLDFSRFFRLVDGTSVRRTLGLSGEDFVIGHVGRFDPQKNHEFLLRVARTAMTNDERVKLLLVGEGRLKPVMEQRAAELGIAGRVIFAGSREDVPDLMLGAMDVFAFPSLWEGLGLAPIEAQVAGLPVVMSTHVPDDAIWRPALVERLALSDETEWNRSLLGFRNRRERPAARECPFDIQRSLEAVADLYAGHSPREVRA
jgi:glycosyltransferase involved in cell wall biosynthesis